MQNLQSWLADLTLGNWKMLENSDEIRQRIKNAQLNGIKYVSSINEAKQYLRSVTAPIIIQFKSLTLGAEDRMEVDALSNAVMKRDIFIFYDEADMLQTKYQRAKSTAAIFKNGAKRN